MNKITAAITCLNGYVPENILSNKDLERIVDTNDEWIRDHTGIRQRYVAGENETTSSLGVEAAYKALMVAGLLPTDLELIICSTSTPEFVFPAILLSIEMAVL